MAVNWREQLRHEGGRLMFVIRNFQRDGCGGHAAALTYTTLFAVVPVLTVSFAILAAIPSMQSVGHSIQNFLFQHFIPSAGTSVGDYLNDFSQQASHLTAVGLCMLLVTAIMMLISVESAFNRIWRVRETRQGIVSFLRYWAVLSLGPLLLGAGFAISSYVASIDVLSRTAHFVSTIIPGLGLVPLVFSAAGFTLIYVAVPYCKVPLRAGVYGGCCAAVLFEAAKRGFTIFVTHFSSYKLIYGAFAAFPIFLLWIYLSWLITLFGVELTRGFVLYREGPRGHRHPLFNLLDILQLFYQRHQRGRPVTDADALARLGRQDIETWSELAQLLLARRIILKTEAGDYVLGRSLDHFNFGEFFQLLPWPLPRPDELAALDAEPWARTLRPMLQRVLAHVAEEFSLPLGELLSAASDAC